MRVVTSPRSRICNTEQDPSVSQASLQDLDPIPEELPLPLSKYRPPIPRTLALTENQLVCPSWLLGTALFAVAVSFGLALKAVPIIQQSVGQIQDNFVLRSGALSAFD